MVPCRRGDRLTLLENAFGSASSRPSCLTSRLLADAGFVWAAQLLVRSDMLLAEYDVSSVARGSELAGVVLARCIALAALLPEALAGNVCDTTLGLGDGYECWLRRSLILLPDPWPLPLPERFWGWAEGGFFMSYERGE